MIHDCLVIGTHDKLLSEGLKVEPGLNLQQAEKIVRQRAAVQKCAQHPVDTKLQMD